MIFVREVAKKKKKKIRSCIKCNWGLNKEVIYLLVNLLGLS